MTSNTDVLLQATDQITVSSFSNISNSGSGALLVLQASDVFVDSNGINNVNNAAFLHIISDTFSVVGLSEGIDFFRSFPASTANVIDNAIDADQQQLIDDAVDDVISDINSYQDATDGYVDDGFSSDTGYDDTGDSGDTEDSTAIGAEEDEEDPLEEQPLIGIDNGSGELLACQPGA